MPASNSPITRYHYIVFFLWLGLTVLAAIYFITSRLTLFDPNRDLIGKDSRALIRLVREIEALENVDLGKTIIHFTSNNCSCTQYSIEHKASINQQARFDGFTVININLPSTLSTVIPSTPSVLIINEVEDVLYLGPYSAGLACSESNGYVETVLQNYAQGYDSNLIISDAKGCYCNI